MNYPTFRLSSSFSSHTHISRPCSHSRVNANLATKRRVSIPCFLSPNPDLPIEALPQFTAKQLSGDALAAVQASAVNLKAWNAIDTPRRIFYQRRINHPRIFEKYWPDVVAEIDRELGGKVRIKY